jgi:hypothetical protein
MKKIMKVLDVIYYNLYIFAHNSPRPREMTATGTLLLCFVFIVFGLYYSTCKLFDVKLNLFMSYLPLLVVLTIFILLIYRYIRRDKYKYIILKKPIIRSERFSKIITIAFVVISVMMFLVLLLIIEIS